MTKAKPLLISFEGVEGSGKSTQIRIVSDLLLSKGFDVLCSREPGGSVLGEAIRNLLLDPRYQKNMSGSVELLFLLAARKAHLEETILPALERGAIVLVDRFIDASIAYQGYGRDLGEDYIRQAHRFFGIDTIPNLTIFLDISLDCSFERIQRRSPNALDRIELSGRSFFEKVYKGYQHLAQKKSPQWRTFCGEIEPDILSEQIMHEIELLL